jgi:hypothetical protein
MKPIYKTFFFILILALEVAFIWWAGESYNTNFIDSLK